MVCARLLTALALDVDQLQELSNCDAAVLFGRSLNDPCELHVILECMHSVPEACGTFAHRWSKPTAQVQLLLERSVDLSCVKRLFPSKRLLRNDYKIEFR